MDIFNIWKKSKTMVDEFKNLLEYWKKTVINFNPGLNPSDLSGEDRTKIDGLPQGLRHLLSTVNGMNKDTEYDKEGFRFYSLKEIYALKHQGIYIFADYLHESWIYGMNEFGVYLVYKGIDDAKVISDSLTSFIEMYLRDSEVIYPPNP